MTHTLETTAISRVVARALRLNEDLVEAIGLGHDTGHTPFGHAGEQALDDALNAAFGRRFRHNEQSGGSRARLNLTHEVCDGILTHTGAQEPETLEGKIVRIVDRVAYINHDIDDAIRYGILSEADLPRAEIELLGATGSERIDRLVHDLVETSEEAGDIARATRSARRCCRSARSCSTASTSGPQVEPEHRRAHEVVQAIFARLVAEPELLPAGEGELVDRITDYISGMTDRFALAYAGGALVARIKDQSVRDVIAAAEHRRRRRPADVAPQELRHALHGPLPVPRGAVAELLGQLRPQPLPLLRLRQGRRRRHLRARDGGARLRRCDRVARGAVSGRGRVRGELAAGGRVAPAARAPLRRARPGGLVLRASSLGGADGEPVRAYLAGRGLGEEIAKEFRLGLSPGRGLAAKAREKGFTAEELRAAGLTNQRGNDYFPPRLMFPLADARGTGDRLPGAQAPRRRSAARGSTSTPPRASCSRRATSSTASTSPGRRSRSRTAPSSSRATPT